MFRRILLLSCSKLKIRGLISPEYGASTSSETLFLKNSQYHISHVAIHSYIIPFHIYSMNYKGLLAKKRSEISHVAELWF